MHIKDSPVKKYKTDFAGFELDARDRKSVV